MTVNAFGVSDQLGDGGTGLAPRGAGPSDGTGTLQQLLRGILATIFATYANAAALTASVAQNRADGQLAVKVDDYSLWIWKNASTDATGTTVIEPTDTAAGSGVGRWEQVIAPGLGLGNIQVGQAVLVAGQSAAIAATITASSKVILSRQGVNASTALGELNATNLVVGAPGSFKATAATQGTPGTPLAGDLSTVTWLVIG